MITTVATLLLIVVGLSGPLSRFSWAQRLRSSSMPLVSVGGLLGLAEAASLAGSGRGAAPVLALLGALLALSGVALCKLSARAVGLRFTSLMAALLLLGAAVAPGGEALPAAARTAGRLGFVHGVLAAMGIALLWAGAIRAWLESAGSPRDFRLRGVVGITLMVLGLAALPGWNGTALDNELGVIAQQDGAPVHALVEVGERPAQAGAKLAGSSVRVPVGIRVPFPGAGGVLILAMGILFLALIGFVSTRPGAGSAGPEVFAPHLLACASGMLLMVVLALALNPLVADPWSLSPEQIEGLVQYAVTPALPEGRALIGYTLSSPGPYGLGARAAWLDVTLLLLAGGIGLATAWQILGGQTQDPELSSVGDTAAGWLAIEVSFLVQGLALLSGSWLARRVWGSAWRADPVELGALLVLTLSGVALAARRERRREVALGLLFLASALALWTLLGAGRLPGPPTLHDFMLGA